MSSFGSLLQGEPAGREAREPTRSRSPVSAMSPQKTPRKRNSIPGLVNVNKKLWKDPPCLMGKSTILTGPFSIAMLDYQRVN